MSGALPLTWPALLAKLPARGPVCIEASAGTGKTYTLEHLLLRLIIEDEVPIEKVLVVTYTEKAKLELVTRLRQRLLEARRLLGDAEGDRAGRARRMVERALRAYDRACIRTIHAFCQETLGDGALPARLLLDQSLVRPHVVSREVLRELMRERIDGDDPTGLALRAFVNQHGFEALARLHDAVQGECDRLVPTWDLAALQAAVDDYPTAAEIEAWLEAKGVPGPRAKAQGLIRTGLTGLGELVRSLDTDEKALRSTAWLDWCNDADGGSQSRLEILTKAFQDPRVLGHPMGARLSEIFFTLLRHAPLPAVYLTGRFFPEVQAIASARKLARGLLDYDDMLVRLDAALRSDSGDDLAAQVRGRFSWVLIDEFQDTDELQWSIFDRLFGQSPGHRIVVVGDPKQAIYSFRGGDLPVYRQARDEIEAAGNAPLVLDTSYRSTASLLEVLGPLFEEAFFEPMALEAPPLKVGRPDDALLLADGSDAPPVVLLSAPDHREAWKKNKGTTLRLVQQGVVDELTRLLHPDCELRYRSGDAEPRRLRPSDCMVLCLDRYESADMGEALAAAGIPHAFFKQEGLGKSAEAGHLRLLLASLASPRDPSARARLWLTPFFELPLASIEAARELPPTHPFHARIDHWCELAAERRFEALFEAILVESGLGRRLALAGDERALTNYLHLSEQLLEEARKAPLSIGELARTLRAAEDAGGDVDDADVRRLETERDAVKILTLHKAKGLEAPVVLLGFAPFSSSTPSKKARAGSVQVFHQRNAQGRIERWAELPGDFLGKHGHPDHAAIAEDEREAERRRLFYVALTRARARLILPAALPAEPGDFDSGSLPGKEKPLGFTVGYRAVNDRLVALRQLPGLASRFELRPMGRHDPADPVRPTPPSLATIAVTLPPDTGPAHQALRLARKAPIVTSFSRMSRGADGIAPPELVADALLLDSEDARPETAMDDAVLPGGVRTGLFLHALLEEASFEQVRAAPRLEDYAEAPGIRARALRLAEKHGLGAAAAERGLALTHSTLRRPLELGAVSLAEGLCAVPRYRPELAFVYPIPEASHHLLGVEADPGDDILPFRVERGFVTGFIDLVFEADGRVFFLDWKSNRLPGYGPEAVAENVAHHYALQARLYTLAVVRHFGIRDAADYQARFGGLAYLYLRGDPDGGLYFERPTWEELIVWERSLLSEARA
ncbi:MAG: UvrD-helicase domain-containing protein [Deltaproteobacteria bacterium]|nr:UvrD-helicase domain-containing protein [Deltaproteobacteria bacterium]